MLNWWWNIWFLNISLIIDYCVGDMSSLWNSSVSFWILVNTDDVCITWYFICIDEIFGPKLKCGTRTKGKKNIHISEFNSVNWSLRVDNTLIIKIIVYCIKVQLLISNYIEIVSGINKRYSYWRSTCINKCWKICFVEDDD